MPESAKPRRRYSTRERVLLGALAVIGLALCLALWWLTPATDNRQRTQAAIDRWHQRCDLYILPLLQHSGVPNRTHYGEQWPQERCQDELAPLMNESERLGLKF